MQLTTQPCLGAGGDDASLTCCVASRDELRAFLAALAAAGKIAAPVIAR